MSESTIERHSFQAEVGQLLEIVTHSLYTDKEIFLRELVSNASDALEKLRHLQLTETTVFDADLPLEIHINTDDQSGTITIQDYGIGMLREELIENIGTIAHSGSKNFLKAIKEAGTDSNTALNLIGQFGVGFYSAFMVAEEVRVFTHSWKAEGEHLLWTSNGKGDYEVETIEGQRRGVKIVLKLKEEDKDFSNENRVKDILRKYSSFVSFPILVNGEKMNTVQALWLRQKSEIKEEEYTEFYKFQANAFDEPLFTLHFSADAPLTIHSLLFVPKTNRERMGMGKQDLEVSLYCKKVMIDSKPDGLFPEWLRFLKGVVDSADIPLNVSRENMQDSALMQKLSKVMTNRFIKFLGDAAKNQPEKYAEFYRESGIFLKEGICTDFEYKEKLGALIRFDSSLAEDGKLVSLGDYVSRMKEGQDAIYYLFAPDRRSIEGGPYLEGLKARGFEVLFLHEPIDEYVMSHLGTFESKKLVAADSDDITLEDIPQTNESPELSTSESESLCKWLQQTLGEKRVKSVSSGKRLIDSPIIALNADKMFSPAMRRMMKLMQPDKGGEETIQPVKLEINPRHAIIRNLYALSENGEETETAKLVAEQLLDNALLAAGYMENPQHMLGRLNSLLENMSRKR
jgi:molecular chaperone HtpG